MNFPSHNDNNKKHNLISKCHLEQFKLENGRMNSEVLLLSRLSGPCACIWSGLAIHVWVRLAVHGGRGGGTGLLSRVSRDWLLSVRCVSRVLWVVGVRGSHALRGPICTVGVIVHWNNHYFTKIINNHSYLLCNRVKMSSQMFSKKCLAFFAE